MTHLFLSILKRPEVKNAILATVTGGMNKSGFIRAAIEAHDDGSEINITVRAADAVSFSRAARAFFQAASQSTEKNP